MVVPYFLKRQSMLFMLNYDNKRSITQYCGERNFQVEYCTFLCHCYLLPRFSNLAWELTPGWQLCFQTFSQSSSNGWGWSYVLYLVHKLTFMTLTNLPCPKNVDLRGVKRELWLKDPKKIKMILMTFGFRILDIKVFSRVGCRVPGPNILKL